jgi:hypothetical protein
MAEPDGPIEVWLSQKNMQVTCRVVHEDERTDELEVEALSIRGAQREITGYLIGQGYKPAGRWANEQHDDQDHWPIEVSRQFVPAKSEVT